jgi:hypothetical protein
LSAQHRDLPFLAMGNAKAAAFCIIQNIGQRIDFMMPKEVL